MLMNCLEWWLYEIAGFLAGIISELELGAQSVVYQLAAVAYMVTASLLLFGFSFGWSESKTSKTATYWGVVSGGLTAVSTFQSQWILFVPTAVSNRFLCGCQCSCWKRPGRWVHRAGQAVMQSLPHHCMYESITCVPVHQQTAALEQQIKFQLHFFDKTLAPSLVSWCFLMSPSNTALTSCPVVLTSTAALFACFIGGCVGALKDVIGYIFTTEEWVLHNQSLFINICIYNLCCQKCRYISIYFQYWSFINSTIWRVCSSDFMLKVHAALPTRTKQFERCVPARQEWREITTQKDFRAHPTLLWKFQSSAVTSLENITPQKNFPLKSFKLVSWPWWTPYMISLMQFVWKQWWTDVKCPSRTKIVMSAASLWFVRIVKQLMSAFFTTSPGQEAASA